MQASVCHMPTCNLDLGVSLLDCLIEFLCDASQLYAILDIVFSYVHYDYMQSLM